MKDVDLFFDLSLVYLGKQFFKMEASQPTESQFPEISHCHSNEIHLGFRFSSPQLVTWGLFLEVDRNEGKLELSY